jgi:hypothetical protein
MGYRLAGSRNAVRLKDRLRDIETELS